MQFITRLILLFVLMVGPIFGAETLKISHSFEISSFSGGDTDQGLDLEGLFNFSHVGYFETPRRVEISEIKVENFKTIGRPNYVHLTKYCHFLNRKLKV